MCVQITFSSLQMEREHCCLFSPRRRRWRCWRWFVRHVSELWPTRVVPVNVPTTTNHLPLDEDTVTSYVLIMNSALDRYILCIVTNDCSSCQSREAVFRHWVISGLRFLVYNARQSEVNKAIIRVPELPFNWPLALGRRCRWFMIWPGITSHSKLANNKWDN